MILLRSLLPVLAVLSAVLLGSLPMAIMAESLNVPGGKFNLEWASYFTAKEKQKLKHWLSYSAESASLIDGDFPLANTTIVLNRYYLTNDAVPWANTIRHTWPEGVSFHVNPRNSLSSFLDDWTAIHEFSHLYIPYPGETDLWLSEGFASYYQNLLMARAGTLTAEEAWGKLNSGFKRGANDQNQNISLAKLSPLMRERRAHMRVYWSGALFFLEADLLLREQGSSLDAIIKTFGNCCRLKRQSWSGKKLLRSFDRIAGKTLFIPLFRKYQQDKRFPDYQRVLAKLGIVDDYGKLSFSNQTQHRDLRKAILKH